MTIVETYLKKPYLITSIIFIAVVIGVIGYIRMPVNLFPDANYPAIAIVTFYPGASSADVEDKVTRIIEREVGTIDKVRRVSSSTKDEVSAVSVEFGYTKGLEAAAADVANALKKITGRLPKGIRQPEIFKISTAANPVMTLSLTPKKGSQYDLTRIRQLADNNIKDDLLNIPNVANVEVFGGYQPELLVSVDPNRMNGFGISLPQLLTALYSQNVNIPDGMIIRKNHQYLLRTSGELKNPNDAKKIVVGRTKSGTVYLSDIAKIVPSYQERQSAYHGNGIPAIAINLLRSYSGNSFNTIQSIQKALPSIEKKYPGIRFDITNTQEDLIVENSTNMLSALKDAILMVVIVIFLFLADTRASIVAAVSIPFTYLLTFAIMYLVGMEFDMVTLTAIVIAVGMLLDDAVVIIENIERHYLLESDKKKAVYAGTNEVMLAVFSGTYATIMVLIPIIFIGGYVQRVLRPVSSTLSIALISSYIVSITVIPLLFPFIMKATSSKNRFEKIIGLFDRFIVSPLRDFFVGLLGSALKHRLLFILGAIVVFGLTMKQMPLVGKDLMSPMDTGIIKVGFTTSPNASLNKTEAIASKMEKIIKNMHGVLRISTMIGSEPDVVSFGSGRSPEQGAMTIEFVNRFHRKKSIWQIEGYLRNKFRQIEGVRYVNVFDYGATPLSSIAAPVDIMISGPNAKVLDRIGSSIVKKMKNVKGITSVSRSWTLDKIEFSYKVNMDKAALYKISPTDISHQAEIAIRGGVSSVFMVPGENGYSIRVKFPSEYRDNISIIKSMLISTPMGMVPLSSLGSFKRIKTQTIITRQNLKPTLDIYGYRSKTPISQIQTAIGKFLKSAALPPGYSITNEGSTKQMAESNKRIQAALIIGLMLLYFALVPAFKSYLNPLSIMSVIPFALVGAIWALLIMGKHQSMPASMGMILLSGIVVKNSILLIDFIEAARAEGQSIREAIIGSVKTRTRPILMTATGTIVGMLPIALEWEVGIERLSPMAVVVVGGLLVSTFLTLIYVPIIYSLFDDMKNRVRALIYKRRLVKKIN